MQMNDPKPPAEEALAIAMQKLNEQGQYILKLEKLEHKINILTKVVLALSFMFTIVFAETVKSFIDIITL